MRRMQAPDSKFQSLTSWSAEPVNASLEVHSMSTHQIAPWCPVIVIRVTALAKSHRCSVPSSPPLTARSEVQAAATQRTAAAWPFKTRSGSPLSMLHNMTFLSLLLLSALGVEVFGNMCWLWKPWSTRRTTQSVSSLGVWTSSSAIPPPSRVATGVLSTGFRTWGRQRSPPSLKTLLCGLTSWRLRPRRWRTRSLHLQAPFRLQWIRRSPPVPNR
mmetsp:Transcript_26516/g.74047  ORF Transcript_26516/g.74047 Transcript_26516/m.74047 type:complete len:215 (+) Transcript_26516:746-1390(+)